MKARLVAVLAVCSFGFAGCSKTDRDLVRPEAVHELSDTGAVAAYDSRGRGAYIFPAKSGLKVCAEPPPDASANVSTSASLKQAIEASAEYELVKAALAANTERSRDTKSEISDVVARSELVLFMRDALYRICELNINGVIDDNKAHADFLKLLDVARHLGQRDNVGKLIEAYVATVNADELDAPTRTTMATALLDAIKALSYVDAVSAGDITLSDTAKAELLMQVLNPSEQESNEPDGAGAGVND